MVAPENVEFIPAGIIKGPVSRSMSAVEPAAPERASDPAPFSASVTDKTGAIEITLPNGTRVAVDASVNEKALARVLRAMKGLT
jgi:transposase